MRRLFCRCVVNLCLGCVLSLFCHVTHSARADSAVAWGFNAFGELGDGTTTTHDKPEPVGGMDSGAVAVASGSYYSLSLLNGGAYAWGYNNDGQLGDGTSGNFRTTPVPATGVTAVAAIESFTLPS